MKYPCCQFDLWNCLRQWCVYWFWPVRWQCALPRSVPYVAIVGLNAFLTSQLGAGDLQAERVSVWDFQRDSDANFDLKPDGWKRKQDRLHPAYIDMRIATRSAESARLVMEAQGTLVKWLHAWETGKWENDYIAESSPPLLAKFFDRTLLNNCLEISMDGGAAELVSPIFPVESRFSYSMRAELNSEALDGHTAWAELQLLDETEKIVAVLPTQRVQGSQDWTYSATAVSELAGKEVKWGRIHVKVEPHSSTVLTGIARFDSIHVYRMPRLSLSTALKYHIARPGEEFQVDCVAMGIRETDTSVRFEMRNHLNQLVAKYSSELRVTSDDAIPTPSPDGTSFVSKSKAHRPIDGDTFWRTSIAEPGLYRIRVNLGSGLDASQQREILIGVMDNGPQKSAGVFGWSLPDLGSMLDAHEIPELTRRFGAGWIKLPVWFAPDDINGANSLVALIDKLESQGIQIVGRLDHAPAADSELGSGELERSFAINTFRNPQDWEPALEPVLTRVGMKIKWFQLGDDGDNSFVGKEDLAGVIAELRSRMQTYSQELKLALTWTWTDVVPTAAIAPWNAVHFANTPQLTAYELSRYIEDSGLNSDLWVSIDPLVGSQYSLIDRIRDLTQRIVVIKQSSVSAAFVTNPLRPELNLFTPEKTVGEMLIPWHTLTTNLGSATYAGSIELAGKSTNHVFADGEQGIMLLWNDTTATEQTFLGEHLTATDLWGKSIAIEEVKSARGTNEQRFQTSIWPILIRGVDLNLIKFRQKFDLEIKSIDNSNPRDQAIPVVIENTLLQSASGKVTIVSPSLLNGERTEAAIQLPSGARQTKSIPVILRNDASAGEHLLRFDFDLMATKPYHFSIHRVATLGLNDVTLSWEANRRNENLVELRVEIDNQTEESVSFDCKLFPPGRPYERFRINASKPGISNQDIRLYLQSSDEKEVWLRCEQIGNGRVLNYRIKI